MELQNRIVIIGLISAVLSQWIWVLPLPGAELVLECVALACAVVAGLWKMAEWLGGRRRL